MLAPNAHTLTDFEANHFRMCFDRIFKEDIIGQKYEIALLSLVFSTIHEEWTKRSGLGKVSS